MNLIVIDRHLLSCLAWFGLLFVPAVCGAQTGNLPGLVAQFKLADGSMAKRVDATCAHRWDQPNEFDERLGSQTAMNLVWSGALDVKSAGRYKLALFATGVCEVKLNGQSILTHSSRQSKLSESNDLELTAGYHSLEITFQSNESSGQVRLCWRGPGFQWEPIGERYLVHAVDQHPSDDFERGRLLARGLRCTGCHTGPSPASTRTTLPAPELIRLKGSLSQQWLVQRLTEPMPSPDSAEELRDDIVTRRMPHFGLDRQAALDIAEALFQASDELPDYTPSRDFEGKKDSSKSKDKKSARNKPSAEEGRTLVLTRGCMACHELSSQELGLRDEDDEASYTSDARRDYLTYQLFAGGDLSDIGNKRPTDYFSRWLARPESINAAHRMPVASLSDLEREDVGLYLATLKTAKASESEADRGDANRGAKLIAQHRCAACHKMPARLSLPETRLTAIDQDSQWDRGCLQSARVADFVPGFELTPGQRRSLKSYWTQVGTAAKATASLDGFRPASAKLPGDLLMAESNCFGCHARHNHRGLLPRAMQIIDQQRELASRLPAMLAPSLNGVGDKLHATALAASITREEQPHRPWLDVRMPKYPFQPEQVQALVAAFTASDFMPVFDDSPRAPLTDDVVTRAAAGRLVTSEGFGCQSCHQIGDQPSPTVALGARGTNLTMVGKRVKRSWFNRWVRNPIRIIPRMEMPAIQLPVHGVLGNDLDRQIDAVWEMLNTEGFQPPSPAPVRVVRKHNLPGQAEPSHVLTDVLETPDRNYLRPLIVGFQNRHNILLDLERGEIGKWWIGDTARELTRGKSWYWELGGQPLGAKLPTLVRFELIDKSAKRWKPEAVEQFVVDFDELEHTESGVILKARMHFAQDDKKLVVPLEISMEPQAEQESSRVTLVARFHAPPGYRLFLGVGDESSQWEHSTVGPWMNVDDRTSIVFPGWSKRHEYRSGQGVIVAADSETEPIECTISLRTRWPVDQFIEPVVQKSVDNAVGSSTASADAIAKPIEIKVVPGFDGVQMPLPRTEMPTALAWHHGKLVVGSLKGRVCLARDTNGDGWLDYWEPISDDLPAPYGIASDGDSIDCLSKFGLVRLSPTSLVGVPWKMEVVADGWGYTADYHDWAVGLVPDGKSYFMALPCQQDDRSASAARLRGTVQRLVPTTPTSSDPRRYRLETVAAGQRFPMGLALDQAGRLFATDNQGNYNPFNEVNHIQAGKRYGFINKLENKPGFNPPLESPAVNLPHPWTRSVNGICFLDTPAGVKSKQTFGPYEGHLIGCEYNGLSLIRMSLEEVDGVMQGAAYLFSRPPADGEPTFEGPVVCAVSPEGDLVVGNIHDSGWGGGQNTGSIVRLRPTGQWQSGIAEVNALPNGLRVKFTGKVDPAAAADVSNYTIRSYRRQSTPAYGGNDQEERQEPVLAAQVIGNGASVDLTLSPLRADSVYELRVGKLSSEPLFPDEAHYTMKKIPSK